MKCARLVICIELLFVSFFAISQSIPQTIIWEEPTGTRAWFDQDGNELWDGGFFGGDPGPFFLVPVGTEMVMAESSGDPYPPPDNLPEFQRNVIYQSAEPVVFPVPTYSTILGDTVFQAYVRTSINVKFVQIFDKPCSLYNSEYFRGLCCNLTQNGSEDYLDNDTECCVYEGEPNNVWPTNWGPLDKLIQVFAGNGIPYERLAQIGNTIANTIGERAQDRECNPIRFIDANLEFAPSGFEDEDNDIATLELSQIVSLNQFRSGTTADGTSQILIQGVFNESGTFEFQAETGYIEHIWGDTTFAQGVTNHLAFALYTPPDELVADGTENLQHNIRSLQDVIELTFQSSQASRSFVDTLNILAPPVILMHGTYSDPTAWTTGLPGQISMVDRLKQEGYHAQAVDYKNTNGDANSGPSSFQDNARVLWENDGGIMEALSYYRDSLNIACTKVDVVGHSLGGVLPRVYASDHYNLNGYSRYDNFYLGDIHRLTTIASTHFGSHLSQASQFISGAWRPQFSELDWMIGQAFELGSIYLSNTPLNGAALNQLPGSDEMALVGRTDIPAHAITCRAPIGMIKDSVVDPDQSYYSLFWAFAMIFYNSGDFLDNFLQSKVDLCSSGLKAGTTKAGIHPSAIFGEFTDEDVFVRMIEEAMDLHGTALEAWDGEFDHSDDIQIYDPVMGEIAMGDFDDSFLDVFVNNTASSISPSLYFLWNKPTWTDYKPDDTFVELFRSLIFDNDDNDGTVRVESQSGEIEKECADCVTHTYNTLHSWATKYNVIQERVLELLNSGMEFYNPEGIPAADHRQKLYYPSIDLTLNRSLLQGDAAVCRSGMVPSHAYEFAKVAEEENVVIISRPVNPDATPLIEKGAATKEMNIKPKSSNWGPQKGYLPFNQRYSKIPKVFKPSEIQSKVESFNAKAEKNLEDGIATVRHLKLSMCNGDFLAYINHDRINGPNDIDVDDEVVLVPVNRPEEMCAWGSTFDANTSITDCEEVGDATLEPLLVMAHPTNMDDEGQNRYLTADYDLLMIGEYAGADNPYFPESFEGAPFDPSKGSIKPEQLALVDLLNAAVQENAGYEGGDVSHHGPENQFTMSPYVDYPLTVFAPDENPELSSGKILSIPMGPVGFRDLHLKRYINVMRQKGYNLLDNIDAPGWQWYYSEGIQGFEFEDSPDLPDYVAQIKTGDACTTKGNGTKGENEDPCGFNTPSFADVLFGDDELEERNRRNNEFGTILISPNLVIGGTMECLVSTNRPMRSRVSIHKNVQAKSVFNIQLLEGENAFRVDVSSLEPGMYTLLIDGVGYAKFVIAQ